MTVRKLLVLIVTASFFCSVVPAQKRSRTRYRKTTHSSRQSTCKNSGPVPSTVGIGYTVVTSNNEGGAWIGGSAFLLEGLLLDSNDKQVAAMRIPEVKDIDDLTFTSARNGWMIADGYLYGTDNKGTSWRRTLTLNKPFLRSVSFSDIKYGWVSGEQGTIYHTEDGGRSWVQQQSGTSYDLEKIFFIDAYHGWAIGRTIDEKQSKNLILLATNDSGRSWKSLSVDHSLPLFNIWFINSDQGWGLDTENNIVHTMDGGKSWVVQRSDTSSLWSGIFFLNELEGWVVGDGILHTTDGGITWSYQLQEKKSGENVLDQVFFTDSQHGWSLSLFRVLFTVDGGKTWSRMSEDWKPDLVEGVRKYRFNNQRHDGVSIPHWFD